MNCIPILAVSIFTLTNPTLAQFNNIQLQSLQISLANHSPMPNQNGSSPVHLSQLFQTFNQSGIHRLDLLHAPNEDIFKNATFDNFTSLSMLYIQDGHIKVFPECLFRRLKNLKVLDISHNELEMLTNNMFADSTILRKPELKFLNISSNKLSSLCDDAFVGLTYLKILLLSNNNLENLNEDLFSSLASLGELDFSFNNITFLHAKSLAHLNKLVTLKMSHSFGANITTLPANLFSSSTDLKIIEIDQNHLKYLPDDIFHKLLILETLNLGHNELTSLNDVIFKKNSKLLQLNLECNQLNHLSKNVFSSLLSLEELNLANNHLSVMDPQIFSELSNLLEISIANNRVDMSGPGGVSNVYNCSNIQYIYASNNTIPTVYNDWLDNEQLEELDLKYNPIPQSQQFNISLKSEHGIIHLTSSNLVHLSFKNFKKCEPNNSRIVDSTILDKNQGCGSQCACKITQKYEPERMYLICNRFNESELDDIPEDIISFSSRAYVEVTLSNCNLSSLYPVNKLLSQIGINKLSLSSNNLSSLDGLPELPQLEVLDVHDNKLTNLDMKVLEVLNRSIHLTNITLHKNPWNCDCSLTDFYRFLESHQKQIMYPDNITCSNKNQIPLRSLPVHELCNLFPLPLVVTCISLAILGLLATTLVSMHHKYQTEIKVWMFSHKAFRWLVTEKEFDRDKKYDAFISYSHQDEWFISQELIPNLEHGENPYKLCIHYRDWLVGAHIPTQIYRSVADSRRTIIVLSPNFLSSSWARQEFQEAYLRAMAEKCPRVIVIMLEDIGAEEQLDDELKAYISTNTYLSWSDSLFWKKLRFALPHKHGGQRRPKSDSLLP